MTSEAKVTASPSTSSVTSAGGSISHITYPTASKLQVGGSIRDEEHIMEEKRLWLGNLDPKLTEFNLLKLVQKYGPIEQFDFLFHRSGPNIGLPRGYAFVEYEDREAASKCMEALNGKRILDRHMVIRWAHQAVKEYPDEQAKLIAKLPALSVNEGESSGPKLSKDKAISAIEAKLNAMDKEKDQHNFTIPSNKASSSNPANPRSWNPGQRFFNQPQPQPNPNRYNYNKQYDRHKKPYSR